MILKRVLICPSCNFTVVVDVDTPLPKEGPVCSMGHPEVSMINSVVAAGQG